MAVLVIILALLIGSFLNVAYRVRGNPLFPPSIVQNVITNLSGII